MRCQTTLLIGATQSILRTRFASQTLLQVKQSFVMADLRSNGCRPKFLRFHGTAPFVTGSVFTRTDKKMKRQRNGQHGHKGSILNEGKVMYEASHA